MKMKFKIGQKYRIKRRADVSCIIFEEGELVTIIEGESLHSVHLDGQLVSGIVRVRREDGTRWYIPTEIIDRSTDPCGNCKNACRSKMKCPLYQEDE